MLYKDKLTNASNNLNASEIERFDALAYEWRNPNGAFANVLAFNEIRLKYIRSEILGHFGNKPISILDVGCGAGLLTQPLAEMGHEVVGIDASGVNIDVASHHGRFLKNLAYRHTLSNTLLNEEKRFDLVLNTEVVEHVPYPARLLAECGELVMPGGMMIVATLNRTWQSFVIGIIGAEYILRALPIGTHSWRAFVTPEEIKHALQTSSFSFGEPRGMRYNPICKRWRLTNSDKVNYLLTARKSG